MSRKSEHLLHTTVARHLGQQILRGEILPGQTLPDVETLGARFHASRTVLREAVKILTAKGMVTSAPRIGVRVRARSDWELLDTDVMRWRIEIGLDQAFIYDILRMRRIIEPGAAELAANTASAATLDHLRLLYDRLAATLDQDRDAFIIADAHFHRGILLASGSELLSQMSQLIVIAIISVASSTAHVPGGSRGAMAIHRAVLDAICAHDGRRAHTLMRELVDKTEGQIDQLFKGSLDGAQQLLQDISADARRLLDEISSVREPKKSARPQ